MSTRSKADLTAERMARRVCSRLVGWLSRRVDDVHSGDASVGSREGDDAGQFVTVEYAKAWVAPDWTAFEPTVGQNLDKLDQSVLTAPADAGESGDGEGGLSMRLWGPDRRAAQVCQPRSLQRLAECAAVHEAKSTTDVTKWQQPSHVHERSPCPTERWHVRLLRLISISCPCGAPLLNEMTH
jgi:hypothetical protein